MAYRSEVGVKICCPNTKTSKNVLDKIKKEGWFSETDKNAIFNYCVYDKDKETITLHTDWIKWYEHYYEDIQAFKTWLRELGEGFEKKEEGGVHFVRIGEELQDIDEEYWGQPEYWIEIDRVMTL